MFLEPRFLYLFSDRVGERVTINGYITKKAPSFAIDVLASNRPAESRNHIQLAVCRSVRLGVAVDEGKQMNRDHGHFPIANRAEYTLGRPYVQRKQWREYSIPRRLGTRFRNRFSIPLNVLVAK